MACWPSILLMVVHADNSKDKCAMPGLSGPKSSALRGRVTHLVSELCPHGHGDAEPQAQGLQLGLKRPPLTKNRRVVSPNQRPQGTFWFLCSPTVHSLVSRRGGLVPCGALNQASTASAVPLRCEREVELKQCKRGLGQLQLKQATGPGTRSNKVGREHPALLP